MGFRHEISRKVLKIANKIIDQIKLTVTIRVINLLRFYMAERLDWEKENKKKIARKKGTLSIFMREENKKTIAKVPRDTEEKLFPPLNNIEINYLIYAFKCLKKGNNPSLPTDHKFRTKISQTGDIYSWVRAYAWQYINIKTGELKKFEAKKLNNKPKRLSKKQIKNAKSRNNRKK